MNLRQGQNPSQAVFGGVNHDHQAQDEVTVDEVTGVVVPESSHNVSKSSRIQQLSKGERVATQPSQGERVATQPSQGQRVATQPSQGQRVFPVFSQGVSENVSGQNRGLKTLNDRVTTAQGR